MAIPIHLLSLSSDQQDFIAHPHHMIVLGEAQQSLVVIEEYFSSAKQYFLHDECRHAYELGKRSTI